MTISVPASDITCRCRIAFNTVLLRADRPGTGCLLDGVDDAGGSCALPLQLLLLHGDVFVNDGYHNVH